MTANEQCSHKPTRFAEYRNWVTDTRRWDHYVPCPGDVIVATYPKCGTTWMQRIVNLLIFQTTEPQPISQICPWYDLRTGPSIDAVNTMLSAQRHRRSIKTHAPLDAVPIHEEVRYIHVARDGRDACLSYHNHITGFTSATLARLNAVGHGDAQLNAPYPSVSKDPAEFFHLWLTTSLLEGATDGYLNVSYFDLENSYWAHRKLSNLLMVHYVDLKTNLEVEMRRVANFLEIEVRAKVWPALIQAASFATMKEQGEELIPNLAALFQEGSRRFFHKGQDGRWKGTFRERDLFTFEEKMSRLPVNCRNWLTAGRLEAGDPRSMDDR